MEVTTDVALYTVNNIWLLISTVLVFVMHLGFSALEAGFVQRKNVVNILFKNAMIISIGLISYCIIGFNLMYPGEAFEHGFFGFSGFGLSLPEGAAGGIDYANGSYHYYTDFIFQAMFAATCATIVSGAVAERVKLESFLIFAILLVSISYPITGMWHWGGGWLQGLSTPFYDFAGSTVVHAAGGAAALAAAMILGPRKGKYTDEDSIIPGHNMTLATIGVFLLWFGWYGFNGGSVLSADASGVSTVFVTTSLAAAAGAIGAFFSSVLYLKSYDLSMVLNGILGGLVGITAGADVMGATDSIIIGLVAGILIPFSVVGFDKLKIDDPVGATTVHLVCGIWGTLAVGIFGAKAGGAQIVTQLIGVGSVMLFSFIFAYVTFYILKVTIGVRVSERMERKGLDITEHDMRAYYLD